ncbi:MAG: LysM peptidoglycan-binding domain-containing protein [Elusimicrobiota bacterium]
MTCKAAVLALAGLLAVSSPGGLRAQDELQDVTVRPGDTLWSISQRYLKDPKRWNMILRYNKLPTSDPTIALPGMTLKVPKSLIKEQLRAATLVEVRRKVLHRKKNTPSWDSADQGMDIFDGDGLRTRDRSWARVKFFGGSVLILDPNSMAILKAPRMADHDLFLKRGVIHATVSRVVTPSARVIPKDRDTKYTARVLDDLSTRVQVYKGAADVQDLKGAKTVEVPAGYYTDVPLDEAPSVPVTIPKVDAALKAEIADFAPGAGDSIVKVRQFGSGGARVPGGSLAGQLESVSVGIPVAAFQLQIARDRAFQRVVFEDKFDAYQPMDLRRANLADGDYWIRVAAIDLLGERGQYSAAKPYKKGQEEFETISFQGSLEVFRPDEEQTRVRSSRFRIMGRADRGLTVLLNFDRVPLDEDGNFSREVLLKRGENNFRIEASDVRGNNMAIIRRITYEP